jgi:hypothetical protein
MSTKKDTISKRTYCSPQIEQVKLDNGISLVLDSNPPIGPGWETSSSYNNSDPMMVEII